ncbi:MAG: hypothetical protein QNJ67_21815 [Kiloniellales bacterium]|nr:hypothetical protein [Kiloniellales bacterium]
MRLGFLALGILSLTLGSAPVAFAQPELYSGLNEGEAVLKTIKDEQRLSGEGLGAATFPGHLLSGAAGVDLGPLRFEGELLYNRAMVDNLSLTEPAGGASSVSTLAGMANALVELPATEGITPFIGGGLGYGVPTSGNMTLRNLDFSSRDEGTMIYQVRAGLDFSLMPESKMSLGYRYLMARDMETGASSRRRIDANQTASHVIELGFRFAF